MAKERAALTELLSTMTLGQLLPHPLSHMLELAPELTASEVTTFYLFKFFTHLDTKSLLFVFEIRILF